MGEQQLEGAAQRVVYRLLWDSAYVIVSLPITLAAYIVCFTLFVFGANLVIIWVGLPIIVAALLVAGWFAGLERERVTWVFRDITRVVPPPRSASNGLLQPLNVGRYWAQLVFTFIAWIPATVGFSVVVSWWAAAFGGITYPAWQWALPDDDNERLSELIGLGDSTAADIALTMVIGVVMLVLLPFVVRVLALMQGWITRGILGRPRLTGRPLPPPAPSPQTIP